jgi:hypothetical protein
MIRKLWTIELYQSQGGKYHVKLYSAADDKTVETSGWSPNEAYRSAILLLGIRPEFAPAGLYTD